MWSQICPLRGHCSVHSLPIGKSQSHGENEKILCIKSASCILGTETHYNYILTLGLCLGILSQQIW